MSHTMSRTTLAYFFALLLLSSCSDTFPAIVGKNVQIHSSAEEAQDELIGGGSISDEKSRTGERSLAINTEKPFGFSITFSDVKKGDCFVASVWRSLVDEKASIIISSNYGSRKLYQENSLVIEERGEWGLINSYFVAHEDYKQLKIYVLNTRAQMAYVDDFEVDGYFDHSLPPEHTLDESSILRIELSDESMSQLKGYRDLALERGVITGDLKEYVKGFILVNDSAVPVRVRLKGDWTDHLESDKWSFRMKISGNNSYDGIKTFSIQNPSTRSFLMEWFAHKLFEHEDVLTTRYTFVSVILNAEHKGVYALEEHFDKQLLERNNRREGPIVKYDESGVWEQHLVETNEKQFYYLPALLSSEILPFKKKRTYKSPLLRQSFERAKSQMHRYRTHDPAVDEYFDISSMAKFMALCDVLNGKHGLIWHNQRNYMNPITGKLEPVAYDCYTKLDEQQLSGELLGMNYVEKKSYTISEAVLSNQDMNDSYLHYLKQYLDPEFFESVFEELQSETDKLQSLLSYEYPFYTFDKGFYLSNSEQLRPQLLEFESRRAEVEDEKLAIQLTFNTLPENTIYNEIALKAYTQQKTDTLVQLVCENFHSAPLEVFGYSIKGASDSIIFFESAISISAFDKRSDQVSIALETLPRYLFYRASNCGDTVYREKVSKWKGVELFGFRETSLGSLNVKETSTQLIILKGSYVVSQDVVIPLGKKIVFEEGVSINLINEACFLSYSPLEMNGTKDSNINIFSSDSSSQGFIVLASGESTTMSHVNFYGLGSYAQDKMVLTGAVTIYEGDVRMNDCVFSGNLCEDGLNLIRSNFVMDNCRVSNTQSDGFDADFCTGQVMNSTFTNTGNDCLDFSGSQIKITHCSISHSGDKGISGGENSQLEIANCSIYDAFIAVAAKDLSSVIIHDLTIESCEYSYACFQKKPEYGPASIEVVSDVSKSGDITSFIDQGSSLTYLGSTTVGVETLIIDSLYVAFQ